MAKKLYTTDAIYVAVGKKIEDLRKEFRDLESLVDKNAVVNKLAKLRITSWIQSVQLDVATEMMWTYTATDQTMLVKLFPCPDSRNQINIYEPELSLVYPIERSVLLPEFQLVINGKNVKKLYESVDRRMEKRARRTKGTGQDE